MESREVLKKYEKVDSFLKRCLSSERYEAVRLIEPCVAVSHEYNKQFKFVILSTDWLYITENPPKNSKDIREVTKITQITSVELINDVPTFLGGDLKYRAHHISITYKKGCELSQREPNNNNISEKQYRNDGSNTLKVIDENHEKTSPTESDELEYEFLQSRRSSVQRTPLVPISVDGVGTSENSLTSLHHSCSSLDNYKLRNKAKSSMRLAASASAVEFHNEKDTVYRDTERLTQSFSGTSENAKKRESSLLGSLKRFKDRKSTNSERKNSCNEGMIDNSSQQLDLYMLLDETVMLAYLRSTWDNCLLNTVLYQEKQELSSSLRSNNNNSSSVAELFDQLEVEIICSNGLKNTFVLVNELFTACQKNVLVKKLFWQSPELFAFLVERLQYYASNVMSKASDANRADELDCMLLLLECLSSMFRETELQTARIMNLKRDKCRVLKDLLLVTVSSPETKVSQEIRPCEISEAAEVLLTGKLRLDKKPLAKKSSHQIELEQLSRELTKHQVTLLHELFIIAYEAVWFATEDNQLNILWMIKILESSQSIFRFLQCLIQQIMIIVTMVEESETSLSSKNTTLLYRLFSVIKTILRQSTKLCLHIQEYYTEEFRYFLNVETLGNNLSKDHLLTSSILKLVEDVIHIITDPKNRKRLAIR